MQTRAHVLVGLGATLSALGGARAAAAAGPLGPNGSRLSTSDYQIDLSAGPVIADTRTTALAGAYVAIAEGSDGPAQNPAGPAVRPAWSDSWFDFDASIGIWLPSMFQGQDFFDTGNRLNIDQRAPGNFVFLTPSLLLQFGRFGVGAAFEIQSYALHVGPVAGLDRQYSTELSVGHVSVAWMALDQSLVAGVGLRIVGMSVGQLSPPLDEGTTAFSSLGSSPELGLLWKPLGLPLRVGAVYRFATTTLAEPGPGVVETPEGDLIIGTGPDDPDAIFLPDHVTLPWQLTFGFAVQLGPRPLNPRFLDPRTLLEAETRAFEARRAQQEADLALLRAENSPRLAAALAEARAEQDAVEARLTAERAKLETELARRVDALPRRYLLVTTALEVTGRAENAIGVLGFLDQTVERSGESVSVGPRLGFEFEVLPNWLQVRAGVYAEPTRFQDSYARAHWTGGFSLKVMPWTLFGIYSPDTWWRLRAAVDIAPRYFGWGVSLSPWH